MSSRLILITAPFMVAALLACPSVGTSADAVNGAAERPGSLPARPGRIFQAMLEEQVGDDGAANFIADVDSTSNPVRNAFFLDEGVDHARPAVAVASFTSAPEEKQPPTKPDPVAASAARANASCSTAITVTDATLPVSGPAPLTRKMPAPAAPAPRPLPDSSSAGPLAAAGTAGFPQNADAGLLGEPSTRNLDPFNAAAQHGFADESATVRFANEEIPVPAPQPQGPLPGPMPAPEMLPSPAPFDVAPTADEVGDAPEMDAHDRLMKLYRFLWVGNTHDPNHDHGIAYERVQYAPYIIDTVSPMNQYGLRIDANYHWRAPDLGALVVAQPASAGGMGLPLATRQMNFQEIDFVSEVGNDTVSARTIIPLRLTDDPTNGDTDGLGDIELDTKLVMLNGQYIRVAQFMGFHFNSGASFKGLGDGHISIEPGFLASIKMSDETMFHAEMKFMFPTPPNANQESNLLTWGFGVSHVLYDHDSFAVIPTIEAVFYSVLNGGNTDPVTQTVKTNDWVTVPTIHWGLRMMTDRVRDLGLIEFGFSGGFSVGSNVWYEDMLRTEVRVIF